MEITSTHGKSGSWSKRSPDCTERTVEKKVFELPYEYYEDQKQYDVTPLLATYTKPKLFLYGTHDTLVSERYIRTGYDVAAEPKQITAIDSEHDYRLQPEAMQQVQQAVVDFLDMHKQC